jgi:hypothetical protein
MRVREHLVTAFWPFEQVLRNGNGHAKEPKPAKTTRYAKPQIKNGRRQAACAAYGAVLLVQKCGFTNQQAIACTGANHNYIGAMKWIVASGDLGLLHDVLHDRGDIFYAAEQVRPLVEIKNAYAKLTSEQRIQWGVEENPDKLFDDVVFPAAVMKSAVMTEPVSV